MRSKKISEFQHIWELFKIKNLWYPSPPRKYFFPKTIKKCCFHSRFYYHGNQMMVRSSRLIAWMVSWCTMKKSFIKFLFLTTFKEKKRCLKWQAWSINSISRCQEKINEKKKKRFTYVAIWNESQNTVLSTVIDTRSFFLGKYFYKRQLKMREIKNEFYGTWHMTISLKNYFLDIHESQQKQIICKLLLLRGKLTIAEARWSLFACAFRRKQISQLMII